MLSIDLYTVYLCSLVFPNRYERLVIKLHEMRRWEIPIPDAKVRADVRRVIHLDRISFD